MSRTSTIGPVSLLNLEIPAGVGIHVPLATDSPATGFHLFTNKVVNIYVIFYQCQLSCQIVRQLIKPTFEDHLSSYRGYIYIYARTYSFFNVILTV